MTGNTVLLPLQLQAFSLNPDVCGTVNKGAESVRIIPITQPNYTFLRLDNFVIQSDVQNHADLHSTIPASVNPRMYNLGGKQPGPKRNRYGIYLHWILPRLYRTGVTSSDDVSSDRAADERKRVGLPSGPSNSKAQKPSQTPEFIKPPTRWILIRKVKKSSILPVEAQAQFPKYQAWVIESDNVWSLSEIGLKTDLQVEMSPFIAGDTDAAAEGAASDLIRQQAEMFIGRKTPLEKWPGTPKKTAQGLSLLTSGNQLFADFQFHNSNVFSTVDNFSYGTDDNNPKYLDEAIASYYLLGWHAEKGKEDPLNHEGVHREKLSALFMTVKDGGNPNELKTWMESKDALRTLCHSAMYNVKWNHAIKPPLVPAEVFAQRLSSRDTPAVSIGTTPMDALLTYCTARKPVKAEKSAILTIEEDLLAIDSLLHARDDGVEGQREAKDTVYNWNFDRNQGGIRYYLGASDDAKEPVTQDQASKTNLRALNRCQTLLDSCQRSLKQLRWNLFALWWRYVSDVSNQAGASVDKDFKSLPDGVVDRIKALQKRIHALETVKKTYTTVNVGTTTSSGAHIKDVKLGTSPFFYRARDPTVLIGGIQSGWPTDYLKNVQVRLPSQLLGDESRLPAGLSELVKHIQESPAIDAAFTSLIGKVLAEFHVLRPGNPQVTSPSAGKSYPQFHDNNVDLDDLASDGKIRFRDQWGGKQPWFPLYAEWEVEYTHVPFEWWSLGAKAKRLSDNKLVRYGISDSIEISKGKVEDLVLYEQLAGKERDIRILSGRTLILPQPGFSLSAKVNQLFSTTPASILDNYLDSNNRDQLIKDIEHLTYLSAPLSGLTDGLITLAQGTHIKPENKTVQAGQEEVKVVPSAIFEDAGFASENLTHIQGNSALTPFAAKANFTSLQHHPFKPVSHGQFRFRRLNIIDKFGQAISALDPSASLQEPPPLWPCISDFYEPQRARNSKNDANTVTKSAEHHCEYIQIPPQINQPVRLNAEFVVRTAGESGDSVALDSYWRPMTEFDNPIWGWVVVNYADFGLQFFLPDGIFYREVRYGGPTGSLTEPQRIPFAHLDDESSLETDPVKNKAAEAAIARRAQLDALIEKLGTASYLKSFWKMIITAQNNLPPPPDAYAQYLSCIVGKPLALANMGCWLELETEPYQNQSTRVEPSAKAANLLDYEFQFKFGDVEREYDGLVGYYDVAEITSGNINRELNLDSFYTYSQRRKTAPEPSATSDKEVSGSESEFDSVSVTSIRDKRYPNLVPISSAHFPKFKPVYVSPEPSKQSEGKQPANYIAAYESDRNKNFKVYGTIFDPFTAIHIYSSILPARPVKLPPWTWQAAMDNMTAFFHAGPLNLVKDVPTYQPARLLTPTNWQLEPPLNVAIPTLGVGEWNWLQPYVHPALKHSTSEADLAKAPVFNSFGIEKRGNIAKPGFEKGPYTATEGFLQLRNPIMKEKPGRKAQLA